MSGNRLIDLTGKRFGSLTVISRSENRVCNGHIQVMWLCRCDCGKEKVIRGTHLKSGAVISCGCVGKKNSAEAKIKHGHTHSRLYGVWCNMKNRCYNANVPCYFRYGGRGVRVCNEWLHDFGAFYNWAIQNGYDEDASYGKCTLDRIDNDGDYAPDNCRFVSMKVQCKNRRQGNQYHRNYEEFENVQAYKGPADPVQGQADRP